MKIMIATDGTDAAVAAAHESIDLFRDGAEVTLLAVIHEWEDPMASAGGFEGPVCTEEEADEDFAALVEEGTSALDRTAVAVARPVETKLVPAGENPGPAIVRLCEELQPDVVVIGAGGKGAFKRFFQGSVSDYVVHHAPCPVLVVRRHS